jgi:hypothetical protein
MRIALFIWLIILCVPALAAPQISTTNFLKGATTNATSSSLILGPGAKTFQSSLTVSSGSGSATVTINGSLDGTNFDAVGTMSPTNTASDSITFSGATYLYYQAVITNITGTGAAVTVNGGN